jgi:DNA-binding SARP family transcriptional activator
MGSPKALSSSRLEIHLLGRFAVYVDGEKLPDTEIKGRKARSLLKMIANQRHHQMVRDHVMENLWPDLDTKAAASQLYKALHHIRKAFARHTEDSDDWIEISDELIRIDPPGGLVTDVQQFEQTARAGLRDQSIPKLEMAVSIYAGDFLPMDRYAEWGSLPREHYRQLYLDTLTKLAAQYEQRGDLSDAAEMLRLALEKEPALETAHRNLMRIFARQGQSTRALRQYDLCRKILSEDLGISPSPETTETLDDVREGRLSKEGKKDTHHASVPDPASPIIGRVKECNAIEKLLNHLSNHKGRSLIISGEVGVGKTRLIRELTMRSRRMGIPFFLGRTGEGTGTVAYGPFIELFSDILHKHPELEDLLPSELGELIPGYSGDGNPVPNADKLAAKGYLFARLHRFFSQLSKNGPLVIIIEDLQAADLGSRELFSYLIRHRDDLPILFAATVRTEADKSASKIISDLPDSVKLIDLPPLSFDEILNLLNYQVAESEVTPDTAKQIYRLSEGNPLFAIELLRHYKDGSSGFPGGLDHGVATPYTGKIPDSLRNPVEQKMETLSPPAHHLLYIAAVIGRHVPYELIASVWGSGENTDEETLFDALEEVIRARLLEERGLDYSFRHALVREAIYSSISEARRRVLHNHVAQKLVELSDEADDEPVEQIAYHFIRSGETLQGARYLVRAGERAEGAYAHEDALRQYHEACEVLNDIENNEASALMGEVLERIGDVYRACGQIEKCYGAYEDAITLAQEGSPIKTDLMELHRKIAVAAIFRTEINRSEKYLKKAFELGGDDPRSQARLLITKALLLWHLNKLEEAYDVAKKALENARKVDAKAEASQACEILAMTCLPLGRWEEGLEYEMERQFHGWSPEIVVATDAHLCLWEYHVSGDQPLKQARSFMEQVAEQGSQVGDLRCVAVCHYALGTMHLWRGQRRRAVKELSSSLDLHERVGSPAGMAYSLARKSVLHTLMGSYRSWLAGSTRRTQLCPPGISAGSLPPVPLWCGTLEPDRSRRTGTGPSVGR